MYNLDNRSKDMNDYEERLEHLEMSVVYNNEERLQYLEKCNEQLWSWVEQLWDYSENIERQLRDSQHRSLQFSETPLKPL